MTDHDLAKEFETKCAMISSSSLSLCSTSENGPTKTENLPIKTGSATHSRSCSLCDARMTKSCLAGSKSHAKGSSNHVHGAYSSRTHSWRYYARSSVSRDLMLKGAMTLRGDGVVEGEIKGQVFSLGEEELVRGEMGFEVVSDPEDDECEAPKQSKLNTDDGKSRCHKSTMTASGEAATGDDDTYRPRKYVQDPSMKQMTKKSANGPTTPQKTKNSFKDVSRHPLHPLPGAPWTLGLTTSLPPGHHMRPFPYHHHHPHLGGFHLHPPPPPHHPFYFHHHHQSSHHRMRSGERSTPPDHADGLLREKQTENSTPAP